MKQLLNLLILTFCFSNIAHAEIVGTWTCGDDCNNRPTNGDYIECAEGYYAEYRNDNEVCEKIKLRYTLQEADEATSDDFENLIEWIFE